MVDLLFLALLLSSFFLSLSSSTRRVLSMVWTPIQQWSTCCQAWKGYLYQCKVQRRWVQTHGDEIRLHCQHIWLQQLQRDQIICSSQHVCSHHVPLRDLSSDLSKTLNTTGKECHLMEDRNRCSCLSTLPEEHDQNHMVWIIVHEVLLFCEFQSFMYKIQAFWYFFIVLLWLVLCFDFTPHMISSV